MALNPITVSQLNEYIGRILSNDPLLGNVRVKGEISNLKYHGSGHVYFAINDENSKVNCFMWDSYAKTLKFQLEDGMDVIINGFVNVYKKGGTYSLTVNSIEVKGEGSLSVAFQQMKDKLEKEGLFDKKYKKPIPENPRKIGIVTSETGAAVKDITKIIQSRTSLTDMVIFPVLVQGDAAAADIAETIRKINEEFDDIDTLIVGRGGGSAEDLWAFNEECLARAVFESRIPIISAVGHEIDFTICDFVADKRAETPTAAAEMAVPDTGILRERIEENRRNLWVQLDNKVKYMQLKTDGLISDMRANLERALAERAHSIEKYRLLLEENDPRKVLHKGYAIVKDNEGRTVSSAKDMRAQETYTVVFKDGQVRVKAEEEA